MKTSPASEGFAADPLTRGFPPGLHWGYSPKRYQNSIIGSRYALTVKLCIIKLIPVLLWSKNTTLLCIERGVAIAGRETTGPPCAAPSKLRCICAALL